MHPSGTRNRSLQRRPAYICDMQTEESILAHRSRRNWMTSNCATVRRPTHTDMKRTSTAQVSVIHKRREIHILIRSLCVL
ncbi:hypothetical protein VZT92_016782 [Zoarces viviparus]|uniref:Uncharacterized protein n=1 Tax=Zoarces viviparus TaxID=48416 RepID=A0AAW1EP71_ZOAVI